MSREPSLETARRVLRQSFGYDAFRPGQERAVGAVLSGRDTLVILPTGGGKSICYQVPALMLPGLTVVISPLISLMKDQVDALEARGLPATFINSTLTANEVADRFARAARGEIKLVYLAPERFDVGSAAERLRAMGVSLLAVDEAHCISEWGHDFRPAYLRIRQVRERLGAPPTVALTATATAEVRRDIVRQLALSEPETVITGFDRRNLRYSVVRTRTESDKDLALTQALRESEGLAVVYASTRRAVERITQMLGRRKIRAVGYHAGLDDAHRREVQEAFMREEARVIVATNAFGMGIDKPNVRLVVHHAMPGTLEAYYQEAGRAGRDGLQSECVLLHAFRDRFTHEFFIKSSYPERETVETVYAELRRAADNTGLARLSPADIASVARGQVKEREAESALRVLVQGHAIVNEPSTANRIWVRLLASPDRIKRELGEGREAERDLLRALWRAVGSRVQNGATIDPAGLPPGFGGAQGVSALLEGLQARQFVVWERTGGGLRLRHPGAPLSKFSIDWDALDRHRRADMDKLDSMQRYAYATGCRRGFLLRYFGDPAAMRTCDGCDICLGTHLTVEGTPPEKTEEAASRPRSVVKRSGRAPRQARTASATNGKRSTTTAAEASLSDEIDPSAVDLVLIGALRNLRTTLAREEKLPAYCIFPDRTLMEMAARKPNSMAALATVRGVGPAKLEKYGELFLGAIRGVDGTGSA
ncbi:MAG TPA: ATP-dependent DNA helicase RecQ [Gemmatimonadaceae bacterium]|nr:ATP-dependent DNA helicase RecQ [Gemmatimonadaceae bacterium]